MHWRAFARPLPQRASSFVARKSRSRLKIVHVNTHDFVGGAARAAYRLNRGMRQLGHDSSMFVLYRNSRDASVTAYRPPAGLKSRLRSRVRRRRRARTLQPYRASHLVRYEPLSDGRSEYKDDLLEQLPAADVVNLHWITDFVDYRAFFGGAGEHAPIVWTLHDMNAFTGGCHYDLGCGRFAGQCGACPLLGSQKHDDFTRRVWLRKRDAFGRLDTGHLHLVAPSRWMAEQARCSSLLGDFPVTVVPNGLDTDDFAPRDTAMARETLGVPQNARVILFVAESVGNRRKGLPLLLAALSGLKRLSNLFLLSVGGGKPEVNGAIPHRHLEYLANDRLLSVLYSAADVYVVPSLQDNLPNTILESLACGTPVVAFDVGGIAEVVRSGVTGLLAPAGDTVALRGALVQMLKDPAARAEMSDHCRRIAVEEYAVQLQARRYAQLYEEVLAGRVGSTVSEGSLSPREAATSKTM